MPPTFVTAYYKCYPDRDNHDYVDQFLKLAQKDDSSFVLFLDPQYAQEPFVRSITDLSNVQVITDVPFQQLPVAEMYSRDVVILPNFINTVKESSAFFILMNSKIDFIKMAIERFPNTDGKWAWIDFGIAKIIKDVDTSWNGLKYLDIPQNKILLPGCTQRAKPVKPVTTIQSVIHWRFCDGLLFGHRETILKLCDIAHEFLFRMKPQITWEVNLWASIENDPQYTDLFQWYSANHNDTMFVIPTPTPTRIIATLMIKNEERIIRRCIERILAGGVDAICISDTGSTDGTLGILAEYLPTLSIPTRVVSHEWCNFGHNRTLSYQAARAFCGDLGWNSAHTYGLLLDADMIYEQVKPFVDLDSPGYRIQQCSGSLEYYNTRLVRMDLPWKCIGVTHEYWDGGTGADCKNIEPEIAYINDVGDGGCKSDKFTRDERLLRKGLEDEPRNERYMFYLAQTLKDLKQLPEAIEMYKRRINGGGWYEEIWYSMYQISKLNYELNNLTEMEYWGMKAFDINPRRSENLYFLTRIFRERSQHHKAWHYMLLGAGIKKPTEMLFIENDVYTHLFDYERTILAYYIQPHKRAEGLTNLIKYYNRIGGHCYSNLQHYTDPIPCIKQRVLPFKAVGDFVPTSTSFVRDGNDGSYILNVRYVNYRIQRDGSYLMMANGVLSRDTPVRTRNFRVCTDANFVPYGPLEEMVSPSIQTSSHIQGVEDLRLCTGSKWIGTGVLQEGVIRQITGTYDMSKYELTNAKVLQSPTNQRCEKNWINIDTNRFIYSWGPFRVLDTITNQFTTLQETPRFFEHIRGSSNLVKYDGSMYTIVHVVQYVQPHKYYHMVIRLSQEADRVLGFTNPFYFKTNAIEYVLGMDITSGGIMKTIVSQNDMDPLCVEIDFKTLQFLPMI